MPSAIPAGYHSVTAYLYVDGAAAAIAFYKQAFGATELLRMQLPDGKIMHAEIKIGDSPVMLTDANPDWGVRDPKALGGISGNMMIYVEDVDAAFARALAAGATETKAVEDQFWGDRMGTLTDPYGHQWSLATHVEDVAGDEMERRFEEAIKQMQAG